MRAIIVSLALSSSLAVLCPRAGGQHPSLDAATAPFETASACAARGCRHRDTDGACHFDVDAAGAADAPNITTVHLIQSNHLDVGYTDNNNGSCASTKIVITTVAPAKAVAACRSKKPVCCH